MRLKVKLGVVDEMAIELKVKRSDWLDPELMRIRDLLHFEGEVSEIVSYVDSYCCYTYGLLNQKAFKRCYRVEEGVILLDIFTTEIYKRGTFFYSDISKNLGGILLN